MSKWMEMLVNPEGLKAAFGDEAVTLDAIDLHELTLHRDGPSATLRFDLASFPRQGPKKWMGQGFNRVQLQLELSGLVSCSIQGWERQCRMDLSLVQRDGQLALSGRCGQVAIELQGAFLLVKAMSAYQHE